MANEISRKLVRRALIVCGGVRPLCALLGVSEDQVEAWLEGLPMPRPLLLRTVELVLDDHEAWMAQDRRADARPPKKTTPEGGRLQRASKEELGGQIVPLPERRAYRSDAQREVAVSATGRRDFQSN